MTCHEIFKAFSEWNPEIANRVTQYKIWGSTSIVIWLRNGLKYKVKYYPDGKFVMQPLSEEDIERKLNLIKRE